MKRHLCHPNIFSVHSKQELKKVSQINCICLLGDCALFKTVFVNSETAQDSDLPAEKGEKELKEEREKHTETLKGKERHYFSARSYALFDI